MVSKLFVFIGLILICSSCGSALKMNEKIVVEGYGQISAMTDQNSVYDSLYGYGDNQLYSRSLTSGDYDQATLKTAYTYRNSENKNDVNVSGRYEAELRMPDGVHHFIRVQSNKSINATSTLSYVNGDLVVGKTDLNWDALNASLSESVRDYSLEKTKFIASTAIKGNFSLRNELEESQKMSCTAGVLLELLDAAEMRGINQYQEVKGEGPRMIVMDGKSATPDVQASYLQRDAADLITSAVNEKDETKKLEKLNKALKLIDQALEIYPNDAVGLANRGTALDYLNRTSEAIDSYEEAVRLDGTNPNILFALGELLYNNEQYENSIHYLEMGLKINPARANGWYWLAQAHYYLGHWSEAEAAISKHLIHNSGDSEAMLFKALIQYQNQSYSEAVKSYESILGGLDTGKIDESERDKYAMDYVKLGMAYIEIGKPEKAKERLNKAKSLFISSVDKDRVDEVIRGIDQNSAGSQPAEAAQTAKPENFFIPSNASEPANGLGSALS